jgi:hypothetical protein
MLVTALKIAWSSGGSGVTVLVMAPTVARTTARTSAMIDAIGLSTALKIAANV